MGSPLETFAAGNDYQDIVSEAKQIAEQSDTIRMMDAVSKFQQRVATKYADIRRYDPEARANYVRPFTESVATMMLRLQPDENHTISRDAVLHFFVTDILSQMIQSAMSPDLVRHPDLAQKKTIAEFVTALFDAAKQTTELIQTEQEQRYAQNELQLRRDEFKAWFEEAKKS